MSKIENSKYFWENKINVLYNKLENPLKDQQYILFKTNLNSNRTFYTNVILYSLQKNI